MELPRTMLDTLETEGERVCRALGVTLLSICVWERDAGILRTIINVGELGGADARPAEEIYPVHSFPALVTLLDHRTAYCFGHGDRVDVASASLAASLHMETQAAAPISLRSEVWGSLWIATAPGTRPLSGADLPRVVGAADEIARTLDALI